MLFTLCNGMSVRLSVCLLKAILQDVQTIPITHVPSPRVFCGDEEPHFEKSRNKLISATKRKGADFFDKICLGFFF